MKKEYKFSKTFAKGLIILCLNVIGLGLGQLAEYGGVQSIGAAEGAAVVTVIGTMLLNWSKHMDK